MQHLTTGVIETNDRLWSTSDLPYPESSHSRARSRVGTRTVSRPHESLAAGINPVVGAEQQATEFRYGFLSKDVHPAALTGLLAAVAMAVHKRAADVAGDHLCAISRLAAGASSGDQRQRHRIVATEA